MEKIYFFAYSHLMDPKHLKQLGIHFYEDCCCELSNYQLEFNVLYDENFRFETQGMPNIVPRHGSKVEGVVYQLDEIDISVLDKEAGVDHMKYYRKSVDIHVGGDRRRAITYTAWPDVTSKGLYPHEECIHKILQAAHHTGISDAYKQWLNSHLQTAV